MKKSEGQWTTWAEFVEGCRVLLRFLSPQESRRLRERARRRERGWDPIAGRPSDEMDMDVYYDLYADATIADWQGLTPEILDEHAALSEEQAAQFTPGADGYIAYSKERARLFLKHSYSFDQFVSLLSTNLRAHEAARRAAATKNSSSAPDAA